MTSSGSGFLAFYESAHRDSVNRCIHHVAHAIAAVGIVGLFWHPLLGAGLVATAFALSWVGHFIFERNTPAFFAPADDRYYLGGTIKKVEVAFGGLVWSAACFMRLFGRGPLTAMNQDSRLG